MDQRILKLPVTNHSPTKAFIPDTQSDTTSHKLHHVTPTAEGLQFTKGRGKCGFTSKGSLAQGPALQQSQCASSTSSPDSHEDYPADSPTAAAHKDGTQLSSCSLPVTNADMSETNNFTDTHVSQTVVVHGEPLRLNSMKQLAQTYVLLCFDHWQRCIRRLHLYWQSIFEQSSFPTVYQHIQQRIFCKLKKLDPMYSSMDSLGTEQLKVRLHLQFCPDIACMACKLLHTNVCSCHHCMLKSVRSCYDSQLGMNV